MELQQLKYFKTVAETEKISDAAKALFISAPALSTSISRLEKELGVQLFDRTNNRITLNEQGRIFLGHVEQVFKSLDAAKKDIKESMEDSRYSIRILVSASNLWLKMLSTYSATHSNVTICTVTSNIPRMPHYDMVNVCDPGCPWKCDSGLCV